MMNNIVNLLKNNKNVSDYRITRKKISSYEMFFVHKNLETVRSTDTEDINVTVYVDGENFKGDSSFAVFPYMTNSDISQKIESAVSRAKLVKNQPYNIVEGDKLNKVIPSNMADFEPYKLAENIADAVFNAECYTNGSLNAVEVFVYKTEEQIVNSRGVDKTQHSHRAMIEAIPTWTENGNSVELYEAYNFTEFNKDDITNEINRRMKEVKDRQIAVKPQVPFNSDVVFLNSEISEILNEIANNLNYATVYSHGNVFNKGDEIAENVKGDKLNLSMIKEIKGSPYSAEFDGDGAKLIDTKIIENGKVKSFYGSNRVAQYLNEKVTGDLVCMKLGLGSMNKGELNKRDYLEVMSMSGIQVDLYNDYIGGEIRLAYYHKDGKVVPVTGISISGRLSNAFANLYLSDKNSVRGYYEGPDFALIEGFHVV